ncbi:MAG: hypothetical protein WA885_11545 [Phormidesmis sp.]
MLYFIVVWTGLLFVCLTVGCGWLHGLHANSLQRTSERAILAAWLGLGTMAILMLAVAIFVPLSPLVGVSVALLAMVPPLASSATRAELLSWQRCCSQGSLLRYGLGYALCSGAIASFISQKVTWLDTGQYHSGFVRWLAEYGITPGLALLNAQFGFVSGWFAIAAPFNFAGQDSRASTVMNGFALLLAVLQISLALKCILTNSVVSKREHLNDWFLLVFSLIVFLLLTQTSFLSAVVISASPDAAIALFTVIVAWSILTLEASDLNRQQCLLNADLIPVILAAAACSIKLTALPLLAIAAGFYLFRGPSGWRLLTGGACISGLMLPFLTAQVLVSGCPLYPSTAACFSLPWTNSIVETQTLAEATHGWGNWFGQPPTGAYRSLWLIQQWLNSNQSSKLTALLIVLSIGSGLYLLTRLRSPQGYSFFWLLSLSAVGIAFMMLKAPLFRFGMGYALLLPMLSVSMLCESTSQRLHAKASPKTLDLTLLAVGACCAIALNAHSYDTVRDRLLVAPPLPSVDFQLQTANGITYAITQDQREQCWSVQLPCVAKVRSDVRLRNPQLGIKGGFVRDPQVEAP